MKHFSQSPDVHHTHKPHIQGAKYPEKMEERGDALMAEGEKKIKKSWKSFFSGGGDDKAHDLFIQATTQYKVSGNYAKVAQAYQRAAEISGKEQNWAEMAEELNGAAKALATSGDVGGALSIYAKVVSEHDHAQRYRDAAKAAEAAGDLPSGEAVAWLERAMKFRRLAGEKASTQILAGKIAESKARTGDYPGAQQAFEELARVDMDDPCLRCHARSHFFMALLAQIAQMTPGSLMEDVGVLEEFFGEYQELEPQFNKHTREHMVITAVIEAIHAEDPSAYQSAVDEYDSIVSMDAVKKSMILKGKQAVMVRIQDLR